MNKNTAIIVAGGSGKRLPGSQKKQFLQIGGVPILILAISPFIADSSVKSLVIVLPEDEIEVGKSLIKNSCAACMKKEITLVVGGNSRQESVFNGLRACPEDTEYVLIHDGVRPFIEYMLIPNLLQAAEQHGAAIPVTPVRYTLKEAHDGMIKSTVPRQNLFAAHTPQVFAFQTILDCHQKLHESHEEFTDDAAIFEHFGKPVAIVPCDETNIKITCPSDLILAEKIYEMKCNKENS